MSKKGHNLTISLISESTDQFGVIEVGVLINEKLYTYPITSEFALRKIKSLLFRHKPGKALKLLQMFKTTGFNSFEKGQDTCQKSTNLNFCEKLLKTLD